MDDAIMDAVVDFRLLSNYLIKIFNSIISFLFLIKSF